MTPATRAFLLTLGILVAPVLARAHSTDFILAKVTPRNDRVEVELTADYGGNPMFADAAEAKAVLTRVLRVRVEGQQHELTELAPLRFEERTQLDPTAPIPVDPATGAEPHRLLCAMWSWKCRASDVAFEMPKEAGQSVILWTPPAAAGTPPRWVFLLSGEVSPQITIPHAAWSGSWLTCLSVGLVGTFTWVTGSWFRRVRAK